MSTSAVVKDQTNTTVTEYIYQKWATIDFVDIDSVPLRIRIDLISSLRPYSVQNVDSTFTYYTQVQTMPNSSYYVVGAYDVIAKKLIAAGWGVTTPAAWKNPLDKATTPKTGEPVPPISVTPIVEPEPVRVEPTDPVGNVVEAAPVKDTVTSTTVHPQEEKVSIGTFSTNFINLLVYLREVIKLSNTNYEPGLIGEIRKFFWNRKALKAVKAHVKRLFAEYQLPATASLPADEGNVQVQPQETQLQAV